MFVVATPRVSLTMYLMPSSVPASKGNNSTVISSAHVQLVWHTDRDGIPGNRGSKVLNKDIEKHKYIRTISTNSGPNHNS